MILLDTNVLLWWLADHRRLTASTRDLVSDPTRVVLVSAVSIWEVAIKQQLGKLEVRGDVAAAAGASGFEELPVTWEHAAAAGRLEPHLRDPFDRMLVAQTQLLDATLVTGDERLTRYDIDVRLV